MRLSVKGIYTQPLRCFKCQRFGHSKTSCRGSVTCAHCAEVGHKSTDCTGTEKCVNCKGSMLRFLETVLPGNRRKKLYPQKYKKISYQEASKGVKSLAPTTGNSYVSVAIKSPAPSVQKIPISLLFPVLNDLILLQEQLIQ
uniref:CCHC-type domain-containing protein n=1 Tax=Araneus ventricosus TaxID=182803 RepID=A0A4Y2J4Q0_ARAVE|nr:hypothetical protein AVEN_37363-1 [Araneus ventricosus]